MVVLYKYIVPTCTGTGRLTMGIRALMPYVKAACTIIVACFVETKMYGVSLQI